MKLIKLNDLDIGITYINTDRIISICSWIEHDTFQIREGSAVEYWDGKGIVELVVTERAEEIQEMVNQ